MISTRSATGLLAAAVLVAAASAQAQPAPVNPADFPDGPGKDIVTTVCNTCHDAGRVRAGYTATGWNTVQAMMENMEAPVPPEDWPTVVSYLTKNFPEHGRPQAVLIPGPVQAEITLWDVPTRGSRPHDPMAARDGSIWWSGQLANKLGRLDPKTGAIREYTLKTPHTAPHGLVEDKAGNIWFTGNFIGIIGKLDPKTGVTTEYKLPDPAAKDPHTLVFDHSGNIKLVHPPTANARPYGMAVNSKNVVHFVEFGSNKIAVIDNAMKIREYVLPDPAARPRRIATGPGDIVWYTDFARGYLGRLDPKTGKVTEWPSPSGPKSQPYGIVFTKGALWYSESLAQPCTIVRFDPQTQKFQSWAIPGGGDIVRNMSVTRDGNPVTADSLANQVGLVTVK